MSIEAKAKQTQKQAKRQAKKARESDAAQGVGRLGFAAKGALYLLIAFLALRVSLGADETTDDRQSALRTIAEQPLGEVALAALAAGLAGYALWRAVEAVAGPRDADGVKALGWRIASAAKSALYGYTCWFALSALSGPDGNPQSGKKQEERHVADALSWSGGRYLVIAVGLGFLAAGFYNTWQGLSAGFREKLEEGWMHEGNRWVAVGAGVFGHVARAVVFVLVGAFLVRAGWQHDPSKAGGLDEALNEIVQMPYGPLLLGLVGTGLGAYGVYALAEARWRKLPSK